MGFQTTNEREWVVKRKGRSNSLVFILNYSLCLRIFFAMWQFLKSGKSVQHFFEQKQIWASLRCWILGRGCFHCILKKKSKFLRIKTIDEKGNIEGQSYYISTCLHCLELALSSFLKAFLDEWHISFLSWDGAHWSEHLLQTTHTKL